MWKTWRQGRGAAGECGPGGVPSNASCAAEPMMRSCSACAGDYEDPDRTVLPPSGVDEAERDDALNEESEEFPAAE